MEKDQKNALLAVVLSAIVLVGWQFLYPEKHPTTFTPNQENVTAPAVAGQQNNKDQSQVSTPTNTSTATVSTVPDLVVTEEIISSGGWSFKFKSDLSFEILQSPMAADKANIIFGDKTFFKIDLGNQLVKYQLQKKSEEEFQIQSTDGASGFTINLSKDFIKFNNFFPSTPKFSFNTDNSFEISNSVKKFIYLTEGYNHFDAKKNEAAEGVMQWIGLDFQYHFYGLVFPTKTFVQFQGTNYGLNISPKMDKSDQVLFGFFTKDYERLKNLGFNLHRTIDFGMFSFLAIPILWLLKKLFFIGENYGLAIILLTLLIRLITFPLQFSSLKGMKRMQKLQPEIQKLKERFKDDPATMQKETIELFKRHKVNPLSGCLPLFLQMPVFFALYSVLYNSVELLHAPFYFWIHDLSLKDPFYVLPVLMTASMFFQQKITPSTITDKTQQKIMLFMPLIFGFFMKDLPSGLNLYILVSTCAGIGQQFFVFNRIKS